MPRHVVFLDHSSVCEIRVVSESELDAVARTAVFEIVDLRQMEKNTCWATN